MYNTWEVARTSSFSLPAVAVDPGSNTLLAQFSGAGATLQIVGNQTGTVYWDAAPPTTPIFFETDTSVAVTLTGSNIAGTLMLRDYYLPPNPEPAGLQKVADTGAAGFALQNGTPTILSWTAPNDGQSHVVVIGMLLDVATSETGGEIAVNLLLPNGHNNAVATYAAGLAAGLHGNPATFVYCVPPGTVLSVEQYTALTAGAAIVYAQIWAS